MDAMPLLDCAGRRRSPATTSSFHEGLSPRNKGLRYPPDPPTSGGAATRAGTFSASTPDFDPLTRGENARARPRQGTPFHRASGICAPPATSGASLVRPA